MVGRAIGIGDENRNKDTICFAGLGAKSHGISRKTLMEKNENFALLR